MAVVRLTRRRGSRNSRSSIILDHGFEQVVSIDGERRHIENKSQYPNLTDWYQSPRRSAKRRTLPTEPSILELRPSSSSVVPSRISSSNQNQQRIESTYPESILIGPRTSDKLCFCSITMRYRSDPTLPPMSHNSRRDEVTIFQVANDGSNWIVFKGFLKVADSFTFKSQRLVEDRFHLKLEINGSHDTTISACCEHPYRDGGRIDDGDSSFWIETVKEYTSCAKYMNHENIDLSQASDDEKEALALPSEMSSKSSSVSHQPQATVVPPSPPPATVPKITTQKDSSPSASTAEVKPADNESTLFEYVNNVMQQALSKPTPDQTIPSRSIGNVENFTILYIDQNEETALSLLRPTVNFIRITNDPNTLGTLLTACTDEKLIVVMSLNQAEAILPELQQHKCIQSIYFLSEQTHLPEWINHYDKSIEIYRNIESIRDHLIQTLPHVASRVISMEITSSVSISDRPFTYCQLLKETALCQDEESDLRKDMLAFCRIHYAHNQEQVYEIDEFEKSFTDSQSIQWYTRYCFLTKILSRTFRTQEIDLLFKMRYFIQSLHKQIQSIAIKEPTTAYAILDIEQETIAKFKENMNGLVLFRSFLSATFAQPTSKKDQIVFLIRLKPDCAANIEQLRSSGCKIDVLINIDTVFRIVSIKENENGVHIVNLESVLHDDSHFQELTASLRKEMKAPVVILQLTRLLLKTDHYREADYLTELVYQDKSFEGDGTLLASLAASHHLLGNVHVDKKKFEAARYQFFKSLRAFQLCLPYDHAMLSSSYNNIGSMFYQEDRHESAIKFHEMALECQLKASSPDTDAIATYSANIGSVYIDQKKYTEAIQHLKRAATIIEKMSTKDNTKSLIAVIQKISSCFWHARKFKEALEYYQKTLDLQLKLPNPLPHPLSVTYYNLSTAYARIGDYDEAVKCAEISIKYLKEVPDSDQELKDNQAQLEIVRQKQCQKQWLAEVLSA